MPSEVDICSDALITLGDEPITSLADNTDRARIANHLYEPQRNAVLTAYPWTFATRRAALAQLSSPTPEWEFANAFQVPVDALFVREINSPKSVWKVEANSDGSLVVNTDLASVSIVYTAKVEDPNRFSWTFTDALVSRLAWRMAFPITGDKVLAKELREAYFEVMQEARSVDSQQGSQDEIESDTLLDARADGFSISDF